MRRIAEALQSESDAVGPPFAVKIGAATAPRDAQTIEDLIEAASVRLNNIKTGRIRDRAAQNPSLELAVIGLKSDTFAFLNASLRQGRFGVAFAQLDERRHLLKGHDWEFELLNAELALELGGQADAVETARSLS